MPGGQRGLQCRLAPAASSATTRGTRAASGTSASSAAARSDRGASSRSSPSRCRTSKNSAVSGTSERPRDAEPRRGHLERVRAAVLAQRDRLAVEHDRGAGSARAAATSSGTRAVTSSSERVKTPTSLAVAVDLDPRAVELALDAGRRRSCASASATSFAVPASIGCTGRPTSSPTAAARPRPASASRGDRRQVARAASAARRTAATGTSGRLGDRVGHRRPASAPWRRSPDSSPRSSRCSASVARANSSLSSARRAATEPEPPSAPIARERRRDVGHGQRRLGRRRRHLAQRRPADADLALQQLAAQERGPGRDLVRRQRAQRAGDQRDLGLAARAPPARRPTRRRGRRSASATRPQSRASSRSRSRSISRSTSGPQPPVRAQAEQRVALDADQLPPQRCRSGSATSAHVRARARLARQHRLAHRGSARGRARAGAGSPPAARPRARSSSSSRRSSADCAASSRAIASSGDHMRDSRQPQRLDQQRRASAPARRASRGSRRTSAR